MAIQQGALIGFLQLCPSIFSSYFSVSASKLHRPIQRLGRPIITTPHFDKRVCMADARTEPCWTSNLRLFTVYIHHLALFALLLFYFLGRNISEDCIY